MEGYPILSWIGRRLNDPDGVWPWAEVNQGLLSVLALVIALAIAVFEVRRAARSETRLITEYIDWVLSCADRSIELTKNAIATVEGRATDGEALPLVIWRHLNANALQTLEEIQPLRPTHPKLAHHVNRLVRCMAADVDGEEETPEVHRQLQQILAVVEISRNHVASLRPGGPRSGAKPNSAAGS